MDIGGSMPSLTCTSGGETALLAMSCGARRRSQTSTANKAALPSSALSHRRTGPARRAYIRVPPVPRYWIGWSSHGRLHREKSNPTPSCAIWTIQRSRSTLAAHSGVSQISTSLDDRTSCCLTCTTLHLARSCIPSKTPLRQPMLPARPRHPAALAKTPRGLSPDASWNFTPTELRTATCMTSKIAAKR